MQHLRCLQTPYLYQDGLLYSRLYLRLVFGCHAAAGAEGRFGPQGITRKTVPLPYPPMAGERAAQRRRRAHALRATVAGALAAMAVSHAAPVVCWGVGAEGHRPVRGAAAAVNRSAVALRCAAEAAARSGPAGSSEGRPPPLPRKRLGGGTGPFPSAPAGGAPPPKRERSAGGGGGRRRRHLRVRLGCRPSGGRYFQPHAGRRKLRLHPDPKGKRVGRTARSSGTAPHLLDCGRPPAAGCAGSDHG